MVPTLGMGLKGPEAGQGRRVWRGREGKAVLRTQSPRSRRLGVGAGKGRIHRKTSAKIKAKERRESVLWDAGTTFPGGCVSVEIRKLWKAQESCLIC